MSRVTAPMRLFPAPVSAGRVLAYTGFDVAPIATTTTTIGRGWVSVRK